MSGRLHPAGRHLAAVLFGLGLLALAELLLRVSPWCPPRREEWSRLYGAVTLERAWFEHPRHVASAGGGMCGPAPELVPTGNSRDDAMQPATFPCRKPPGTIRIAVLGGSSVQGFGLRPDQTFPSRLQQALAGATELPVEVLNLGVAGYTTTQIRRMLPELWPLEPDLVLLYAGHNDYAFFPVVQAALRSSGASRRTRALGDRFALWRGTRRLLQRAGLLPDPLAGLAPPRSGPRPAAFNQPPLRVPSTRSGRRGLVRDQLEADRLIRSVFAQNVQEIDRQARGHGAGLVLLTPVCRLDAAPSGSMHWRELDDDQLARWDALWAHLRGPRPRWSDPELHEALGIDDSFSELLERAAGAAWQEGMGDEARRLWAEALERIPPSRCDRAPRRLDDAIVELGAAIGRPVLDLRPVFDGAPHPPGQPWADPFIDTLHLDPSGARLAAGATADFLLRAPGGLPAPVGAR